MRRLCREQSPRVVKVLPIRGYRGMASDLEEALSRSAVSVEPASGSGCGRTFGYSRHPLDCPAFVDVLLDFRMVLQPFGMVT
jgi:hypothetical protein